MTLYDGVATGRVRRHRHCGAPARLAARLAWLRRSPSRERVEDLGALVVFLITLRTAWPERFSSILRGVREGGGIGYELLGDGDLAAVLRGRDGVSC